MALLAGVVDIDLRRLLPLQPPARLLRAVYALLVRHVPAALADADSGYPDGFRARSVRHIRHDSLPHGDRAYPRDELYVPRHRSLCHQLAESQSGRFGMVSAAYRQHHTDMHGMGLRALERT